MYINFKDLTRDTYGNLERPTLILKRPHGDIIGVLKNAFNLQMDLKFSETSEATFDYPRNDGPILMPMYHDLVKDKIIEVMPYGVFIIDSVDRKCEGIKEYCSVTMQSIEYVLSEKHFVLAKDVYSLESIMTYILESAHGWNIGSIDASLLTKHRAFDTVDTNVLDFLRKDVQDSFDCIVVFDTFAQTINLVDATKDASRIPVYFSYKNLVENGTIKTLGDPVVTKLYVQGADGVDIRNVNPTGDNYLYNIDWYIEKGDIPEDIVSVWRKWENEIFTSQSAYSDIVAARNNKNAEKLSCSAELTELNNKKKTQEELRITLVQRLATIDKSTENGESLYSETESEIAAGEKLIAQYKKDIESMESKISEINTEITSFDSQASAINNRLRVQSYFNNEQLDVLNHYFKEGSLQDSTFAVIDYDLVGSGDYSVVETSTLSLSDIAMTGVDSTDDYFTGRLTKGSLTVDNVGEKVSDSLLKVRASIIGGTVEIRKNDDGTTFTSSMYLSPVFVGDTEYGSATLTVTGQVDGINNILNQLTKTESIEYSPDMSLSRYVYDYTGSVITTVSNASVYLTKSVSEYQQYCMQQELYDYAKSYLVDKSRPACEFDVESGNFIVAQEFEYFRNNINLGHACYLDLGSELFINPVLLEIHINFEDPTDFNVVFSNAFRRARDVERLSDAIRETSAASRKFESNKFAYGMSSDTTTAVRQFLNDSYDLALAKIQAGTNNTVTIDGAGIKVDSTDDSDTIHINNGMIALVDNSNANHVVKMAMGRFKDPEGNDYVGIMADIIAGTLIAGETLHIECPGQNGGIMQFKVDAAGVTVNNGRWYMKSDNGRIALDPDYGILAGNKELFEIKENNRIDPTCYSDGEIVFDDDGFPKNTNLLLTTDGHAYFRGDIYAENGRFNGVVQASQFLNADGDDMFSDDGKKISGDYLELLGLTIKNSKGDTILYIGEDGIEFSSPSGDEDDVTQDLANRVDNLENDLEDVEDTVGGWQYNGGTYIDGSMIKAGTVMASSLQGGEVLLLDEDEDEAGYITIENASSADYAIRLASGGALSLMANDGNIYIESDGKFLSVDGSDTGDATTNTNFRPNASDTYSLGRSWALWSDVYAGNGTISTSDAEKKTDIQYDLSVMDDFYDGLQPVRYKFKNGQSGRYHCGYISQDVEQSLQSSGLSSMDFAGFIKSPKASGDGYDYALRYSEFIALNTWQIQRLKDRIVELESKIDLLIKEVL